MCSKAAREVHEAAHAAAGTKDGAATPKPPKQGQPALKWIQVSRLPRTLTLHLKRFSSKAQTVAKLDDHVPFPLALDFSPFA